MRKYYEKSLPDVEDITLTTDMTKTMYIRNNTHLMSNELTFGIKLGLNPNSKLVSKSILMIDVGFIRSLVIGPSADV